MSSSDGSRDGTPVTIVSVNQETLDDLQAYLRGVGVEASSSRHLGIINELGPSVLALIVFPDDFPRQQVIAVLRATIERRPRVLPVLVTSEPRPYEENLPDSDRLLIVSRPIWAWTIYDIIRDHLATRAGAPSTATKRKRPSR